MNHIRKAFATLGGIFLAALLIAAFVPKATHGLAAVLVQVTNSSANPIPLRDVGPSSEVFVARLCFSYTGTGSLPAICGTLPAGVLVPSTTADGKTVTRLVVEELSGGCETNGSGVVSVGISGNLSSPDNIASGGGVIDVALPPGPLMLGSGTPPFNAQTFGSVVRFYADPATLVGLSYAVAADVTNSICYASVIGYLATQ